MTQHKLNWHASFHHVGGYLFSHAIIYSPVDPIAVYEAQFGVNGTSNIFLDEVQCRGDETSLIECQHEGFGRHNCIPSNAASAICTGECISCPVNNIHLMHCICILVNYYCTMQTLCVVKHDQAA